MQVVTITGTTGAHVHMYFYGGHWQLTYMCVYDCTGSISFCVYPLSSVHVSMECVVLALVCKFTNKSQQVFSTLKELREYNNVPNSLQEALLPTCLEQRKSCRARPTPHILLGQLALNRSRNLLKEYNSFQVRMCAATWYWGRMKGVGG